MSSIIRDLSELSIATSNDQLIQACPVVVRKRVAFGDCDPAGIVYTPRFADYLVQAFFWFHSVLIDGLPASAIDTPMRGLELDFRGMLAVGDVFEMTCRVQAIRVKTYDLWVDACKASGETVFAGRLTPIAFDRDLGLSVPIPLAVRERLIEYAALPPSIDAPAQGR